MQTRRQSLIEVFTGVGVGYVIALAANQFILPCFGKTLPLSVRANLIVGVIYTAISVARGYTLRRLFNFIWRS